MSASRLVPAARRVLVDLQSALNQIDARPREREVGRITKAGDGVARARGLESLAPGDIVDIEGASAHVEAIRDGEAELVLLEGGSAAARESVRLTSRVLDVPAGRELVGRVLDPLGRPVDGLGPLSTRRRTPVFTRPIQLRHREPVGRPLRTGVLVVDTMVPVGRGQRQLIIGDRGTGKTSLCLDVLSALDPDLVGIYVAVGRRGSETASHLQWLRDRGFFDHGFAVVSDADDPIGLVHLTPYSATAMAEDLMLGGRDVVIVYDDLTTHANAHRTLALLLDRPVSREAFPADIFYAHAQMLERATQLSAAKGGGSLTALPIVETQLGDLTGYIPTNLVSITDGQIRLHAGLVATGQLPAVDVALSVSRVGGRAQPHAIRAVSASLKNRYAQFLELETFTRFGTQLEENASRVVQWGKRVRLALRQPRGAAWSWGETFARAAALSSPTLADRDPEEVATHLTGAAGRAIAARPEAWSRLLEGEKLDPEMLEQVRQAAAEEPS